ncbi:hypothetical protein SAMN04487925_110244 [Bradyrhizobium sp. cf659]|nr:hypothetical protein SAMN04487925_110244 [Bradyrhizobium sp. cf659]
MIPHRGRRSNSNGRHLLKPRTVGGVFHFFAPDLGISIVRYAPATLADTTRGCSPPAFAMDCCVVDASTAEIVSALRALSSSRSAKVTRANLLRPASLILFPAEAVIMARARLRLSPTILRSERQSREHCCPSAVIAQLALVNPTSVAKSLDTCDATRFPTISSQSPKAGTIERMVAATAKPVPFICPGSR